MLPSPPRYGVRTKLHVGLVIAAIGFAGKSYRKATAERAIDRCDGSDDVGVWKTLASNSGAQPIAERL